MEPSPGQTDSTATRARWKIVVLDPKDDWSPRGIYNEMYYMACTLWHKRCVSDYFHPPRRYRSWDLKASFVVYLVILLCEGAYYTAWRQNPVGHLTIALGYVLLGGLALEHMHTRNLDKWRERVGYDTNT